MAVKLIRDIFDSPAMFVPLNGSTDLGTGEVVYRDTANSVVKAATSSVGTTLNLFGVTVGDSTATATIAQVIPIIPNTNQTWEVDCTNDTAANQLLKAQAMTNSTQVNNTSTAVATTLGVFIPTAVVGLPADRKLQGYFVVSGQVTA